MAIWDISLLRDDFEDNTIAPAWATSTGGSATVAETGGQAVFTLPSSTAGSHSAYYTSVATYDLTGDAANVAVGTMVATGVAATAYILQLFADALNSYQWVQLSGTIKAQKVVNGTTTDLFSASWSSSTHKYLRIRESGGTVYFDTSTSGSAGASWTNRGSTTIASAFAVTSLFVQFGASCGNIASPGSLKLDMFNIILPAVSGTWRWTDADWQITNRMRPVTLASTGNKQGVLVTAGGKDASNVLTGTVRYFAGPVGSASGGYAALTEYSTLAAAEACAFDIPVDGRVDLPALVDCRLMRLYHRSTDGASGTIREFMPRRIVQADDIEAETIKALHISVLDLDASHYITAGGGVVTLNDEGINIDISTAYFTERSIDFNLAGARRGSLYGYSDANGALVVVEGVSTVAAERSQVTLLATGASTNASLDVISPRTGFNSQINAIATNVVVTAAGAVTVTTPTFSISGGLNVNDSGATAGQVLASDNIGVNGAIALNSSVRIAAKGTGTSSSTYTFGAYDSGNTVLFYVRDDGGILLSKSGGLVGFYGTSPASKQTVTGSRGGNAALASLLTALANIGLITNSSSA